MKKSIWIVLLIMLVLGACALLLQTKAANTYSFSSLSSSSKPKQSMQLYTNAENEFQISYPSDWMYRSYEGGVGFQPKEKPTGSQYEYISISISPKPGSMASLPFAQYVKVAAQNEIQNYQKLASLQSFSTADGQKGYLTTWMVQPLGGGKPTESLPIAYLPARNSKNTIEVFLNDKKYMDVFTNMLSTFQYTK